MAEARLIRRSWLLASRAAALALAAAILPATAAPRPADGAGLAGTWDLSLEGSHRKCRLVLGSETAGIGRTIRFPAGCRRALPILVGVEGWIVPQPGALRLINGAGQAALELAAGAMSGTLEARAGSGDLYRLERSDRPAREARSPAPSPIGGPQPTTVDLAKAPARAALPGTYAVDRFTERDVCRIVLGAAMLNASGRFEARMVEGCRDPGLAAFDPVAWEYERGRLKLVSRRDHEVTLVSEREGLWRCDPDIGAPLVLRRGE